MPETSNDRLAGLDAALRAWKAKAGDTYHDAATALRQAHRHLNHVTDQLNGWRQLRLDGLADRLKAQAAGGDAAALLPQLEALDDVLASYHIELQTLAAQAARAVEAGRALADAMGALHLADETATPLPPLDLAQPADRERMLDAEVVLLRAELESARHALDSVREAAAPMPAAAQDELARLRAEVAELRAVREADPGAPAPGGEAGRAPSPSAMRFHRILSHAYDDSGHRRPLGAILVRAGVISAAQLEDALREQRSAWNRHLGALLVELGYASEEDIAQTLAAQTRVPYERLDPDALNLTVARIVSAHLAQHHTCIPLRHDGERLVVAMANPIDLIAQEDLRLATGREVAVVVATATAIRAALRRTHGASR